MPEPPENVPLQVEYTLLYGADIGGHLDELANLRITVFKEFPYLYEGDLEYEQDYLSTYVKSKLSLAVLATHRARVIGATTCIPLGDEVEDIRKPYLERGRDIDSTFYFGESIVLKEFRGNKIGRSFFEFREAHARKRCPGLRWTTFCSVIRPDNHPLKPRDYKPLDSFWRRMGYRKDPEMVISFPWKDIDKGKPDHKDLCVWLKSWS
jgi:GNAT superfamily N-acetyltransferase